MSKIPDPVELVAPSTRAWIETPANDDTSGTGEGPPSVTGQPPDGGHPSPASPSSDLNLASGEGPPVRGHSSELEAPHFWTEERVALLLELQAKKLSGRRIAVELGITRNSVMGKLARMGMHCLSEARPKPGTRRSNPKRAAELKKAIVPKPARPWRALAPGVQKPAHLAARVVATEPVRDTNCTLLELTNWNCRYPVGKPMAPAKFFCGAPEADMAGGVPYCREHRALCYQHPRGRL